DHYEEALKELLKKKQAGEKIEAPREREPAKVINLMDALRRSVGAEQTAGGRRKPPRSSAQRRTAKRASRSSARHNKAGERFHGGGQRLLPALAGRGRGSRRGQYERRLIGIHHAVMAKSGRSVRSATHLGESCVKSAAPVSPSVKSRPGRSGISMMTCRLEERRIAPRVDSRGAKNRRRFRGCGCRCLLRRRRSDGRAVCRSAGSNSRHDFRRS